MDATMRFVSASTPTSAGALARGDELPPDVARTIRSSATTSTGQHHQGRDEPAAPGSHRTGRRRFRRGLCERRRVERGVLFEDRPLQPLQLRCRIEPQLGRQQTTPVAIRLERIGLSPTAVEREHPLAAQALAQRVRGHERRERSDDLRVPSEPQQRLGPVLDRREAQLLQPPDLLLREVLERELCEGRTAPERERRVEGEQGLRGRSVLERTSPVAGELLEARGVERDVVVEQRIARRPRDQEVGASPGPSLEQPAKVRDVSLHGLCRGVGGTRAPQGLDDQVGGDDRAVMDQQQREQLPLAPGGQPDGTAIAAGHFDRTEDVDVHLRRAASVLPPRHRNRFLPPPYRA